jgi:hypothetical protein
MEQFRDNFNVVRVLVFFFTHILFCLVCSILPVFLYCPFLIAISVFSGLSILDCHFGFSLTFIYSRICLPLSLLKLSTTGIHISLWLYHIDTKIIINTCSLKEVLLFRWIPLNFSAVFNLQIEKLKYRNFHIDWNISSKCFIIWPNFVEGIKHKYVTFWHYGLYLCWNAKLSINQTVWYNAFCSFSCYIWMHFLFLKMYVGTFNIKQIRLREFTDSVYAC